MIGAKFRNFVAVPALVLMAACSTQTAEVSKNDNAGMRSNLRVSTSSATTAVRNGERAFTAYLTGYGFWDNTPPGSTAIARPVVHRGAGGKGTYRDPITIAVGHVIAGGRQTLDYPAGTRFYISRLRKYAIVEDVCGDGLRPQDGPCHAGYKGHPWLDIYIGGAQLTSRDTTACAYKITSLQQIIINPRPDYPVHVGEIAASGCKVF